MNSQWLESVYSDGSKEFVSNPSPKMKELVKIKIRMYEAAPVKAVFLRTVPNGAEKLIQAVKTEVKDGLCYYEACMEMTEIRMQYHFYLVCEDIIYYYTQKEITSYIPDHTYDFVLLADYKAPEWVKSAVFYQIFPERFCNGNPENDVQAGEYKLNGHDTIKMNWNDPPLPYEKGFCLDFYGGDLEGVMEKIPYLKELGVTAIYLNPIFLAPSIHKYDCIDYFHVDPHFGGDEALAKLSDLLHENGMKLMLDISINHTGTAHKWFNRDGLFFDKSEGAYNNIDAPERDFYFIDENNDYLGWFDVKDLPVLNYTSERLRDIIYRKPDSVLKKWLKPPYNIDGWRFDVADVLGRNNEIQLAHEIWPEIRKSIKEENEDAYILAEDWGDVGPYLQGKEWDSAMNYYGCGRVIRQFFGDVDLFLGRNEILRNVPYKMTAMDAKNRIVEHLAKIPFVFWQNQFNLFDSHDVSRLHTNEKINVREYRGAVIMLFTLIGAANIYYGDEAEIGGDIYTTEAFRYPMPWDKDIKSTDSYKLYSTLAKLKAEHEAFSEGGMNFLYAEGNILAIARFYGDDRFVAVLSTSDKDELIRLPLGVIGACEPVSNEDIFGSNLIFKRLDEHSVELQVKAHESYLFKC